jgi:hypothetical protein
VKDDMFPLANGDCPAKQAVPVSGTQSQQKPVCFSYMLTALRASEKMLMQQKPVTIRPSSSLPL